MRARSSTRSTSRSYSAPDRRTTPLRPRTTERSGGSARTRERRLHLAPETHRRQTGVEIDIGPTHRRARGDCIAQMASMREPQWQPAECERLRGRHQFSVHREPALAVERLADAQFTLRGCDDVGIEVQRSAGGLAAQSDARDADAEFETDEMKWLVHRGIASARIGDEAVLLEATLGILAATGNHDIHAPAQVAKHRPAVAFDTGDHLDLAALHERPAFETRA